MPYGRKEARASRSVLPVPLSRLHDDVTYSLYPVRIAKKLIAVYLACCKTTVDLVVKTTNRQARRWYCDSRRAYAQHDSISRVSYIAR